MFRITENGTAETAGELITLAAHQTVKPDEGLSLQWTSRRSRRYPAIGFPATTCRAIFFWEINRLLAGPHKCSDEPMHFLPAHDSYNLTMSVKPYLSVVIPVFNEEANIAALEQALTPVLAKIGKPYEIIFIDDGSTDASLQHLRQLQAKDAHVVVIEFSRNFGQHSAIFAGLDQSRGEIIVTLDADLQNPPEAIPTLVRTIEAGYDVVGGWRENRHDPFYRRVASKIVNRIVSWSTGVKLRDYGCMLRAYRRPVVDQIRKCSEISSFIPALANTFARSIAEIEVPHRDRAQGQSKYSIFRLIRLNFDLMTGFSLFPIQMISVFGLVTALGGMGFGGFLLIRRFIVGPEAEGLFTLFAILFGFVGIQIFALGLIGEYVGRIYNEVRKRPRFVVREIYGPSESTPS